MSFQVELEKGKQNQEIREKGGKIRECFSQALKPKNRKCLFDSLNEGLLERNVPFYSKFKVVPELKCCLN